MYTLLSNVGLSTLSRASRVGCTRNITALSRGRSPPNFIFLPGFFSKEEQHILLRAALEKLDALESRQYRRRRKEYITQENPTRQSIFLPDAYYCFEEGHYDGVIKHFREAHVSSWPEDNHELLLLLERIRTVHPPEETQTHVLHLASHGEILPHVDNLEASGSWILGICLGDTRVLRLEHAQDITDFYEVLLEPGTVYLQKDQTRYDYKHSILKEGEFGGIKYGGGQRLSIMIRDRHSNEDATYKHG